MLYGFLLTLLILDALLLIGVILLQSGKGGGIAANFGGATSSTDAFIGTRQAGNLLTKASWWCGGIFLGLAFILQLAGGRTRIPQSVLDRPLTAPASSAPAPGTPTTAAPAVPLEAPTTPAPATPGTQTPAPAKK